MKAKTKSSLYAFLAADNDAESIRKKRVGRRIARRVYGKLTGRLARKLFS